MHACFDCPPLSPLAAFPPWRSSSFSPAIASLTSQVGGSQAGVVCPIDHAALTAPLSELSEMEDEELIELFRTRPPLKAPHGIRPDGTGGESLYVLFRDAAGALLLPVCCYEAGG